MIRFNEEQLWNKALPYSSIRSEKSTDTNPVQFKKHNSPIPRVVVVVVVAVVATVVVDGSNTTLVSDAQLANDVSPRNVTFGGIMSCPFSDVQS